MAGGTQVVSRGHPAYTYAKDAAAGQVSGQGVKDQGGTTAGGASSSSSKGSGGYGYSLAQAPVADRQYRDRSVSLAARRLQPRRV
jgi:hypothetical protein